MWIGNHACNQSFDRALEVRNTMGMFNRVIIAGTLLLAGVGTAYSQVSSAETEQIRARQQIATMETVLASAVQNGTQNVVMQIRRVVPDYRPRTNQPRVSGARLDDYGLVFHVDVPLVPLPFLWDVMVLEMQTRNAVRTIQQLRTQAQQMPEGSQSAQLISQANQLEQELALGNFRAAQPGRGLAAAASLQPVPAGTQRPTNSDPSVVDDPESAYTREVKTALIDAMLNNSQALGVKADEWLTIIARDGAPTNPQSPGDAIDASTQIMRVKGSTLAAFQSRTISIEEARKLVEIQEQ